jgi:8-oxo-dGTP diphosphatase
MGQALRQVRDSHPLASGPTPPRQGVRPRRTQLVSKAVAKKAEGKSATRKTVRAAGGVVWRRAPGDGRTSWWRRALGRRAPNLDGVEVVLVHRPGYDDWSIPKGKPDGDDESDEDTARREVEEETGLLCGLGPELASSRYVDGKGRDKVVRYWAMTVEQQRDREPDDEVDEWRWVPLAEAEAMLTYDHDRTVLTSLRAVASGV